MRVPYALAPDLRDSVPLRSALRSALRLLLVLTLGLLSRTAAAHEPGQSYVFLSVYDDRIDVQVQVAAVDLDQALGLSLWADDTLTTAEVQQYLDRIRAYVDRHTAFAIDGNPSDLRFQSARAASVYFADYAVLEYAIATPNGIPDAVRVRFDPIFDVNRDHVNLVVVKHNWQTATFNAEENVQLVLNPISREGTVDLSSSSVFNGFWGLVKSGVWHIWIGWDHILFLLALVLPSVLFLSGGRWVPVGSFRPAFLKILGVVTAFTVAHSITLTLAALGVVTLPSRFVESVIAASIIAAALYNLYPRLKVREWVIAFVFGLFHGFGFASVMGDIGMEGERMALSVLGFNVGVELGQIAIIAVVFPILYLIRTQRWYIPVVLRLGSLLLIATAAVWLAERVFDIEIFGRLRSAIARLI